MNIKCDIHIIHSYEPQEWVDRCVGSLTDDMFVVRVVKGEKGKIGEARVNGYSLGTAPYVASCDPDDVYSKDVIKHMIEVLEDNPMLGLVYSGELAKHSNGRTEYIFKPFDESFLLRSPMAVHGAIIFRREALMPILHLIRPIRFKFERWLCCLAVYFQGYKILGINMEGRIWTQHEKQSHHVPAPDDYIAVRRYIALKHAARN